MCNPAIIMVASTALSAYSQYSQGQQAKAQSEFQSKVEYNNAVAAKYQADNAARLGEIEREELRLAQARGQAQGQVAYAAGNVQLGSGTPLSWSMDYAEQGARDIEMSRYNTESAMYGYNQQARNLLTQSGLSKTAGRNAAKSSILSAAGTVASGASRYYRANQG